MFDVVFKVNAIESPKYQTSVSLKRFEKLEVFSLLPRINQLKTKNNLKCRFIIKIKNTNGSTISWKPIELHIQLDNPQSIVIPIDQIKKTAFTIPNGFTGQPIISCTNYESGFGFSGDDLFYEKTQFAPEEDMRLKHPVQECVFVFQNLADGVLHVSPRYLIDFQMDSQIAVSYQFTPELVPHYPRGENPLYFQMNIVNQGIFPTTLDFGPARNIKLSAEYYYVPPTNVGVAIKNMQPELVMTVSKAYSGTYPNGSNFITLEPGESISVTAHVDLGYFYINTCTILVGGIPAGIYRLLALKLQMTDPVYFHEAVLLSEKNDNSELIRRRELGSDMRSQLQAARMHYWDLARYHQMVAWQSDNVALSCR